MPGQHAGQGGEHHASSPASSAPGLPAPSPPTPRLVRPLGHHGAQRLGGGPRGLGIVGQRRQLERDDAVDPGEALVEGQAHDLVGRARVVVDDDGQVRTRRDALDEPQDLVVRQLVVREGRQQDGGGTRTRSRPGTSDDVGLAQRPDADQDGETARVLDRDRDGTVPLGRGEARVATRRAERADRLDA